MGCPPLAAGKTTGAILILRYVSCKPPSEFKHGQPHLELKGLKMDWSAFFCFGREDKTDLHRRI